MQRRIVLKDVDEQLVRDNAVDVNAGADNIIQRNFLLNDHQRAGLHLAHLKRSLDQLIDRVRAEQALLLRVAEQTV